MHIVQVISCILRATLPSPGVIVSMSTPIFGVRQGLTRNTVTTIPADELSCLGRRQFTQPSKCNAYHVTCTSTGPFETCVQLCCSVWLTQCKTHTWTNQQDWCSDLSGGFDKSAGLLVWSEWRVCLRTARKGRNVQGARLIAVGVTWSCPNHTVTNEMSKEMLSTRWRAFLNMRSSLYLCSCELAAQVLSPFSNISVHDHCLFYLNLLHK